MMVLQPVLVFIPEDRTLTGPERVVRQRAFARRALAACAERCGLAHLEWSKDENDVPQPCSGYHWSVSHKPRWAAAVIADRPVGIDLEQVKPRGEHLFDEIADDPEWAAVGGQSWPALFRVWTAKEAVLKANGVGIGKLASCRIIDAPDATHLTLDYEGRRWCVEHYLHGDHLAAVTVDADPVVWLVHEEKSGHS
ncbi:MAG: 4'-phosphopantetheinyl transferase superfamily protein [Planctomycetota bacterium]